MGIIMLEAVLYLALNIYHEARNEPITGQIAVAEVTLNRVDSPYYPDTVKKVVLQSGKKSCAFSWTCDGKSDKPYEKEAWRKSVRIAETMFDAYMEDARVTVVGDQALFYHASYVRPYWLSDVSKIRKIGRHIFYGRKG